MGTWQRLTNDTPATSFTSMCLLTDGTVLCFGRAEPAGGPLAPVFRLTPASDGSYRDGAWSAARAPGFVTSDGLFASCARAVLADGRVIVFGARDPNNAAEIYDPLTDAWQPVAAPVGWIPNGSLGPCCVLADGRVMYKAHPVALGSAVTPTAIPTWIYAPATGTWDRIDDTDPDTVDQDWETWTLLPDGSVLSIQWTHQRAERFLVAEKRWIPAAKPPDGVVYDTLAPGGLPGVLVGAALLLADGRVLVCGCFGANAFYTPPPSASPHGAGTWSPAPANGPTAVYVEDIDTLLDVGPGCLLPSGHSLWLTHAEEQPAAELDGDAFAPVPLPPPGRDYVYAANAVLPAMLLPTGQVLFDNGRQQRFLYTPSGLAPDPAWAPHIETCPSSLTAGGSYGLTGQQLNGVSQAVCGAACAPLAATNYPLVRLTNMDTGAVFYARTHDHSSMGVATGAATSETRFDVPPGVPDGPYELCVVANGIAACRRVEVVQPHVPVLADPWVHVIATVWLNVITGKVGTRPDPGQGPDVLFDPRTEPDAAAMAALARALEAASPQHLARELERIDGVARSVTVLRKALAAALEQAARSR